MFTGHYAAALALKAREPRAPTWAVLIGTGVLDLIFGVLVLAGVEKIHPTPGVSIGVSLDFIDWSHSLAMALVWSALYAALFLRRGRAVMAVLALAVFSHFLLDWPMHPGDLALWPYGPHTGAGLWVRWPIGWWFFEAALVALGCAYYLARAKKLGGFGKRPWAVVAVLVVLHVANSPWLMPSR